MPKVTISEGASMQAIKSLVFHFFDFDLDIEILFFPIMPHQGEYRKASHTSVRS